jgi:hypothetical protein
VDKAVFLIVLLASVVGDMVVMVEVRIVVVEVRIAVVVAEELATAIGGVLAVAAIGGLVRIGGLVAVVITRDLAAVVLEVTAVCCPSSITKTAQEGPAMVLSFFLVPIIWRNHHSWLYSVCTYTVSGWVEDSPTSI